MTIDRRSYLPFVMGFIAVLPYSSLLLSGKMVLKDGLYSDYGSFQLPVREFVSQELAEGRFPHWIPWLACGIPLHATQQVGICYPLLTPLLWLFNANIAIKMSLFLHVVLCYWGQYRLGRQLKLSVAGASIAALICTQSGFLCMHLAVGHVALVLAYALVPWLWSSVIQICHYPSLRGACRFAVIVAGLLLTGHPQIPYYALLFGGVWAAASLVIGTAASHRLTVVSAFATGLSIGIAIAAVQILPTWELFQENGGQSMRGTVEYASTYCLSGLDLYRLLVPSLFGNPMVDIPEFMAPDFYHEKVCYLGMITWCLAISALFSGFSSRWPWGIAGLIVLGLFVALGDSTPLFSWLCASVPGLTLFRCPGRCLSMVSILMALLAGRGFDSLTQPNPGLSRRSEIFLAAVFVFLALAVGVLADLTVVKIDAARWIEFAYANLRWQFAASAFATLAAIITCWLLPRFSSRFRPLIVALLAVTDLGYFNLRSVQFADDFSIRLTDASVTSIGTQRFIDGDTGLERREVRYSRCVAAAVRTRTRMIGTNEGGVLPHGCEEVFAALETNPDATLRMAACRSVWKKNSPLQTSPNDALPRIWFCPDSLQDYLDKSMKSLTATNVDHMFTVANEINVEVVMDESQRIVVQLAPDTSGTLVIADTWYPGWKCRVNEKDSEIRQAFHCFRGVSIDAGTHLVELRYEPKSFFNGLVISVSGIGVLFSISVWRPCRSRGSLPVRT